MLSQFARLVDPEMLVVDHLGYASAGTVLFQRVSVIVVDVVLFLATRSFCSKYPEERARKVVLLLTLTNAGLLLVDHVHFQYNGVMLGLLVYSLALVQQGRFVFGGMVYAALLNMKHIFIYVAPVFFIYLLSEKCFSAVAATDSSPASSRFNLPAFLELATAVLSVCAVSFGPFVLLRQIPQVSICQPQRQYAYSLYPSTLTHISDLFIYILLLTACQVLSRLFPFGERGLVTTPTPQSCTSFFFGSCVSYVIN